jgi:glutathione S-transferase
MTYQLYYSPGACSLAPHIVLREAGAAFDLVKVSTKTHELEAGGDFYAINPKGYVPALGLPGGEVLTEGPAISQYIADLHPAANLAPPAGTLERARVQEWLTFIGTELHKSFAPMFTPGATDEQKARAKDQIVSRMGFVEKALSDGRSYLVGDSFTVADAYLFVIANWARFIGMDFAPWPSLAAFQGRVAARPAVQAALKAEGLA